MKAIASLGLLLAIYAPLSAARYECRVKSGAYVLPGSSAITDAFKQDKALSSAVFFVDTETGKVTGTSLFDSGTDQVRVIRNPAENDANSYVVSFTSDKADTRILSIKEFEGKITFTFYSEFFRLFLVGECQKVGGQL